MLRKARRRRRREHPPPGRASLKQLAQLSQGGRGQRSGGGGACVCLQTGCAALRGSVKSTHLPVVCLTGCSGAEARRAVLALVKEGYGCEAELEDGCCVEEDGRRAKAEGGLCRLPTPAAVTAQRRHEDATRTPWKVRCPPAVCWSTSGECHGKERYCSDRSSSGRQSLDRLLRTGARCLSLCGYIAGRARRRYWHCETCLMLLLHLEQCRWNCSYCRSLH